MVTEPRRFMDIRGRIALLTYVVLVACALVTASSVVTSAPAPTAVRASALGPPAPPAYAERIGGSSDLLYSFPTATDGLSVGRSGAVTMALRVPVPEANLRPSLFAYYSSHGSDGQLGVGWTIPVPKITLDFSNGFDVVESSPGDHIKPVDDQHFLRDRWVAHPGGPLVCEDFDGDGTDWHDFDCFVDPRGATKYETDGSDFVETWRATDPLEGVTQVFGGSPASRIERDGRPMAWLLSEEVSLHGQSIRYLYEERHTERLRVAVVLSGDRVIRFLYDERDTNINTSFALGVERRTANLLTEIQVLDGCVPVQDETTPDRPTVDFSPCEDATIVERVHLTYKDPTDRYSGRYVLESWRHASGDDEISYRPITFEYEGDTDPARGDGVSSSAMVEAVVSPSFAVPDGFTLPTGAGHAPFQTTRDWDRDGLPDVIHKKRNPDVPWPTWDTVTHEIYVHLRNADGRLAPRRSYAEPLVRYCAWMHWSNAGFRILEEPLDIYSKVFAAPLTDPNDLADAIESNTYWAEATVGITVSPWMYFRSATAPPIFESLSMSVDCEEFRTDECEAIKDTYESVWGEELGEFEHLSIKLTDLIDVNGDGFLDRLMSGLMVLWDPEAPDADEETGLRDPATGDPCIYVSYFEPAEGSPADGDFLPFTRYDIDGADALFDDDDGAFLSALAVSVLRNREPSASDNSTQTTVISPVTVIGLARGAQDLLVDAVEAHVAMRVSGSDSDIGRAARAEVLTSAVNLGWMAVNAASRWGHLPPEVAQIQSRITAGCSFVGTGVRAEQLMSTPSLTGWASVAQPPGWLI